MKYLRQSKILELIDKNLIDTQEELVEKLKNEGMDITQATVSRDIRELRLIKVSIGNGKQKYATIGKEVSLLSDKLLNVFIESFRSCDYANNIIVIKTLPAMAQAAASAVDSLKWPEILGTIAGDDTVMVVCRTEKTADELSSKFTKLKNRT